MINNFIKPYSNGHHFIHYKIIKILEKKQLQYWSEIAHQYFKTNKINESSLSELDSESCKLFEDNGTGIKKRLAKTEVLSVLDQMINEGKISWKMQNMKENFIVFQHSIYELADSLYNWVQILNCLQILLYIYIYIFNRQKNGARLDQQKQ
eukprot:TRINITY_DN1486_c0_g1_i2.p1 TRINITY_DN1486_c0_g1~~TRINITY_DN1486_c0_g1_i2.p1  ORF type:complete len:151 (-),score=12.60 TRINITY_DN1486_c0_g1_i2:300-752(-)